MSNLGSFGIGFDLRSCDALRFLGPRPGDTGWGRDSGKTGWNDDVRSGERSRVELASEVVPSPPETAGVGAGSCTPLGTISGSLATASPNASLPAELELPPASTAGATTVREGVLFFPVAAFFAARFALFEDELRDGTLDGVSSGLGRNLEN